MVQWFWKKMVTTTKNKTILKIFAAINRFATIDYLEWIISDIKQKEMKSLLIIKWLNKKASHTHVSVH